MQGDRPSSRFDVHVTLQPFAEAAIVAFERSYPNARVSVDGSQISIFNAPPNDRREFMHLLYREKIYQETLDLRRILYARLGL